MAYLRAHGAARPWRPPSTLDLIWCLGLSELPDLEAVEKKRPSWGLLSEETRSQTWTICALWPLSAALIVDVSKPETAIQKCLIVSKEGSEQQRGRIAQPCTGGVFHTIARTSS